MTKNELKNEICIVYGKVSMFEEITTTDDKKELMEYRISLHKELNRLCWIYITRYDNDKFIKKYTNIIDIDIIMKYNGMLDINYKK